MNEHQVGGTVLRINVGDVHPLKYSIARTYQEASQRANDRWRQRSPTRSRASDTSPSQHVHFPPTHPEAKGHSREAGTDDIEIHRSADYAS